MYNSRMALSFDRLRRSIRGPAIPLYGSVLGIDIGTASIKIVQLGGPGAHPTLETYGEVQLDQYGAALSDAQIGGALADLMHEVEATARRGGVSVPQSACFATTLQVPKRDDDQMRKILPFEARRYIPVPLEHMRLEWMFLAEDVEEEAAFKQSQKPDGVLPHLKTVLMLAIEKSAIAKRERSLETANVHADFLEAELFPLMRAHRHTRTGPLVILDLGASSTKVFLYDAHGGCTVVHTIPGGGAGLTADIAANLSGADTHAAEEAKRAFVASPHALDKKTAHAVEQAIETYLKKLKEDIASLMTTHAGGLSRPIAASAIGGGHALATHIPASWWEKQGIQLVQSDPFAGISTPIILEESIRAAGPRYAVAVGLALRALRREPGDTITIP